LAKYGFEDLMAHPPFNRFLPKSERLIPVRDGRPVVEFTRYQRIRMVCEELGATFIKFAQIASNRPDVLPEDLIAELAQFQDHGPAVPKEAVKEVLEEELKRPLEEIFEHINYKPIASASMAQVHRARLRGGKEVVLKVQRPGIQWTIEEDIIILRQLAQMLEHYFPQYEAFQPLELVKMFERSIRKELKFTVEATNVRRFQQQFKGNEAIYVPDVYPEFTTDRVLCMEYIDGVKITDVAALEGFGMTGPELALKGIGLYFEQVFEHGFFHADPHPGNIFVLPDKKVCFIDYGMMGTVIESDKELLADLLLSVHNQEVAGLRKALLKFASDDKKIDVKSLDYDIIDFFTEYSNMTIDEIEGEEIIQALNSLFFDYKIKVPSNLLLLLKALVIIEGVGLTLDPKYNIIKNIEPYVRRLLEHKYAPAKLRKNMTKAVGDLSRLATTLPEELESIIRKVRQGKLHIEFEHKGLTPLYEKMETVSNRIAFTLLLVALILGSSIIVVANVPPFVYNIPLVGFIGFLISGFLALRLLFSIMRHGNF
jgi:ubiquinone biosynthesis protein